MRKAELEAAKIEIPSSGLAATVKATGWAKCDGKNCSGAVIVLTDGDECDEEED